MHKSCTIDTPLSRVLLLLDLLPRQPLVGFASHENSEHAKGTLRLFGIDLSVIGSLVFLSLVGQAPHVRLEEVVFLYFLWHCNSHSLKTSYWFSSSDGSVSVSLKVTSEEDRGS